jgi:hypothetical protein
MAGLGRDGKPKRRSRRGRGEESDGCIVPVKPRTRPTTNRRRRWWREGGRPEGRRAATHAPDSVPDTACRRRCEPADRGTARRHFPAAPCTNRRSPPLWLRTPGWRSRTRTCGLTDRSSGRARTAKYIAHAHRIAHAPAKVRSSSNIPPVAADPAMQGYASAPLDRISARHLDCRFHRDPRGDRGRSAPAIWKPSLLCGQQHYPGAIPHTHLGLCRTVQPLKYRPLLRRQRAARRSTRRAPRRGRRLSPAG